jgi:hypothetical protein
MTGGATSNAASTCSRTQPWAKRNNILLIEDDLLAAANQGVAVLSACAQLFIKDFPALLQAVIYAAWTLPREDPGE